MDFFDTLLAEKLGGGGGGSSVTVEELSVTQNGTYTAPTGKAYSPVNVNVSGGSSVEAKDVNFYDYDGTLLHSYTAEEFAQLSELPSNPSHDGLTAQGWNWTLQEINTQLTQVGGYVEVGQTYVTDDNKTRLYCEFDEYTLSPVLGFSVNGTVEVDWGDNSATSTMSGTSISSKKTLSHTYSSAGSYVIAFTLTTGSMAFFADTASSKRYPYILNASTNPTSTYDGRIFYNCIKKIEMGSNVTFTSYSMRYLGNLETITIPNGMTSINTYCFDYCSSLKHVTIPKTVTTINASAFNANFALKSISLPYGLTTLGEYPVSNAQMLKRVTIPYSMTSLPNYAFSSLYSLEKVAIPPSVSTVGTQAFANDYSLKTAIINNDIIGSSSFSSALNLPNVIINGDVTTINVSAFNYCPCLTKLTLPSTLTTINGQAFSSCNGMREYHFKSTTPPTLANTEVFANIKSSCVIYVPSASLEAYQTASNWSTYASHIQGE